MFLPQVVKIARVMKKAVNYLTLLNGQLKALSNANENSNG